jgi:chemotaxis protein methyltransferase CheR
MNSNEFTFLSELLHKQSGLVLGSDKGYLLESRLNPVARKHGCDGVQSLVRKLKLGADGALTRDVVEAMTTNESFFFRDSKPFDQFRDLVLPKLIESRAGAHKIRIWSAACSSGQEPYFLAMLLSEQSHKLQGWNIEILATDLSTEILERARQGLYSQFEVQRGLPITLMMKYFQQAGDRWQISEGLRKMVRFRVFNLLDSPAGLGNFDIVFLRNVLIYFDTERKAQVLERLSRQIALDGFLFLGGAETVLGISDKFKTIVGHRGIYEPAGETSKIAAAN